MAEFRQTPYAPVPYGYRSGGTIAELLARRGDIAAQGALQSGQAWSNAAQQIGQMVGQTIAQQPQIRLQEARAKREEQMAARIEAAMKREEGDRTAMDTALGQAGPGFDVDAIEAQLPGHLRLQFRKSVNEANAAALELKAKQTDYFARLAAGIKPFLSGEDGGMGAVQLALQHARAAGVPGTEKMLEQIKMNPAQIPQLVEGLIAQSPTVAKEFREANKLTEVSAGASLYDPEKGQSVFTAPSKPSEPPKVGTFEDYVLRKFGPNPAPEQIESARKAYNQSDDRPLRPIVPVVVQTANGPQLVDRTSGQARSITDAEGKALGLAPTADERNRSSAMGRAQPVLDSITELSERINTGKGVLAKISGTAERAKAQANLSDDVSEYEAVVSGFTPMLARAVGHVGILTEQDVQSVRRMLPHPDDSKSIRDRKMARINKILNAQSPGAPAAPAGGVKIKSITEIK